MGQINDISYPMVLRLLSMMSASFRQAFRESSNISVKLPQESHPFGCLRMYTHDDCCRRDLSLCTVTESLFSS